MDKLPNELQELVLQACCAGFAAGSHANSTKLPARTQRETPPALKTRTLCESVAGLDILRHLNKAWRGLVDQHMARPPKPALHLDCAPLLTAEAAERIAEDLVKYEEGLPVPLDEKFYAGPGLFWRPTAEDPRPPCRPSTEPVFAIPVREFFTKTRPTWQLRRVYFTLGTAAANGHLALFRWVWSHLSYRVRYSFLAKSESGDAHGPLLQRLCLAGNLEMLRHLVELGVDCDASADDLLEAATRGDHLHVIEYLVSLYGTTTNRSVPAMLVCDTALQHGHVEIYNWALKKRQELNLGVTALEPSCLREGSEFAFNQFIQNRDIEHDIAIGKTFFAVELVAGGNEDLLRRIPFKRLLEKFPHSVADQLVSKRRFHLLPMLIQAGVPLDLHHIQERCQIVGEHALFQALNKRRTFDWRRGGSLFYATSIMDDHASVVEQGVNHNRVSLHTLPVIATAFGHSDLVLRYPTVPTEVLVNAAMRAYDSQLLKRCLEVRPEATEHVYHVFSKIVNCAATNNRWELVDFMFALDWPRHAPQSLSSFQARLLYADSFNCLLTFSILQEYWSNAVVSGGVETLEALKRHQPKLAVPFEPTDFQRLVMFSTTLRSDLAWDGNFVNGLVWAYQTQLITTEALDRVISSAIAANSPQPVSKNGKQFLHYMPLILAERGLDIPPSLLVPD